MKTPGVSIQEALDLFLAVTYPNGIPEGIDKEQLLRVLREKIAKDRPEWARADAQNQSTPQPETQNYSRIKDEIVQQAQKEEIPEDPEERYFYMRRKEARENRLKKEAEAREKQIREDLSKRLTERKNEDDKETLDKALRIRQALEQRITQALKMQQPDQEPLTLKPPAVPSAPLKNDPPRTRDIASPEAARQFFQHLEDLEPAEQIRGLQQFNRDRREQFQSREDVVRSSKRDSRKDRRMEMSMEKEEQEDSSFGVSCSFEPASKSKRQKRLSVDIGMGGCDDF